MTSAIPRVSTIGTGSWGECTCRRQTQQSIRYLDGLGTDTETPHQALVDDAQEARSQHVGFDIHIRESTDGLCRAASMKRGNHEMSGQRGLQRTLSGLAVADPLRQR